MGDRQADTAELGGSTPFDWLAGEPRPAADGVDERLAFGRLTGALLGRARWPKLSRYEVERPLGRGAFGRVLLARDPELDRTVAIKVIGIPTGDDRPTAARVAREAKALAALRHPNVVQIYDVGTCEGSWLQLEEGDPAPRHEPDAATGDGPASSAVAVFLVMEYLPGRSLRAYCREHHGDTAAIVRAFDRVAAGLVAVHDAGLVHRDVKPDNVVLGEDGDPRLVDFGLVRTGEVVPEELEATAESREAGAASVTATGSVLGTPSYMAPEQHEGHAADPASDQYALAVSLYEALGSTLPFAGDTMDTLATAKRTHAPTPALTPLPPRLARVLGRALSPLPADRYPSMQAFRDALREASRTRRRAKWWAAAGVLAVLPLAWSARGDEPETSPTPAAAATCLETQAPALPASEGDLLHWAEVSEAVDAWSDEWTDAKEGVCARPHQDGDVQARRIDCLQRTHARAASLFAAIGAPAKKAETSAPETSAPETNEPDSGHEAKARARTERAVRDVTDLPRPGECIEVDDDDLAGLPDDHRAQVAALERRIATLESHIRRDAAPEHVTAGKAAIDEARALDHPPTIAAGLDTTGRLALDLGQYEEADAMLTDAIWTSLVAKRPHRAALLVPRMLYAKEHGGGPAAFEEALPMVESVLAQADPPPQLRARIAVGIGHHWLGRGDWDRGAHELRRAIEAVDEAGIGPCTERGEALTGLSTVARRGGDLDEALSLARRALAELTEADGPDASTTAFAHERLGSIHFAREELQEAAAQFEQSVSKLEARYGPDHPDLAWPRTILAMTWSENGRHDEAAKVADAALATAIAAMGEDSDMVATITHNRSIIAERQGDYDLAIRMMQRSRASSVTRGDTKEIEECDARIDELQTARDERDPAAEPPPG